MTYAYRKRGNISTLGSAPDRRKRGDFLKYKELTSVFSEYVLLVKPSLPWKFGSDIRDL